MRLPAGHPKPGLRPSAFGMIRPLDKLRAIAHREHRPPGRVFSLSSFISSAEASVDRRQAAASCYWTGPHEKNETNELTFLYLEERAAIIEHDGAAPRAWAEAFAALCAMLPPAGFSTARWQRIIDATGVFLDCWAAQAIRCGW